ncbi:MAG: YheT family hydrolase [Cyanobacteriota bacterium]
MRAPVLPGQDLIRPLALAPLRQRLPWIGGDLQTLRDTVRPVRLPPDLGRALPLPLPGGEQLLGVLDAPTGGGDGAALVVLLHGLGGSSDREGLRRLALALQDADLAVLRLNLRGAGAGRPLAAGTYAAECNADLLPVLAQLRTVAAGRPLFGVGLSLGGTILLNALLVASGPPLLDGLVCLSSPLDLAACSARIAQPRNRVYARWLLKRLVAQTLEDPFGIPAAERLALTLAGGPSSIRVFDQRITAPRWGYGSVEQYYAEASPLAALLDPERRSVLPPTLLVHAEDDPWVPVAALHRVAQALADSPSGKATAVKATAVKATAVDVLAGDAAAPRILISRHGGHNGFHGRGDSPRACWGDRLTVRWLLQLLASGRLT